MRVAAHAIVSNAMAADKQTLAGNYQNSSPSVFEFLPWKTENWKFFCLFYCINLLF